MPRIRYCATAAGRVAYWLMGTGPPLLCESGWITDLRAQLDLLSFGSFVERLAEQFTVIRYDKLGGGLSATGTGRTCRWTGRWTRRSRWPTRRVPAGSTCSVPRRAVRSRRPSRQRRPDPGGDAGVNGDVRERRRPGTRRGQGLPGSAGAAHRGLGSAGVAGAFVIDPTAQDVAVFGRFQRASASAPPRPAGCRRRI